MSESQSISPAAPIAAAVQMCSGADLGTNLDTAAVLVADAAGQGAELIVLPEYFPFMGMKERDKYATVEVDGEGSVQDWMRDLARQNRCWLVGGSIPVQSHDLKRPFGRCYVYGPGGEERASYDKVHLFDVAVADNKRSYRESATCMPGEQTVVVDTPWGGLGLAICYDLRFPELFRRLTDQGARIIALPAAFTETTGKAHWEMLIRTRAVENQCFMIASAQGGVHQNGRCTWGHSAIIDPWGTVLAEIEDGDGLALASLDLTDQERIRAQFPALSHRVF